MTNTPTPTAPTGIPFAGFKQFTIGLALATLPQIVSYITSFDFVHTFGLSPNAASVVGVLMIALRAVTTSPIFQKG